MRPRDLNVRNKQAFQNSYEYMEEVRRATVCRSMVVIQVRVPVDEHGSTFVNHWQRGVPVYSEPVVTPALLFFAALAAVGFTLALARFVSPLGRFSGMNDAYAWGIWKTFNVLTLTALGSGPLAVGMAAWVFNREKLHSDHADRPGEWFPVLLDRPDCSRLRCGAGVEFLEHSASMALEQPNRRCSRFLFACRSMPQCSWPSRTFLWFWNVSTIRVAMRPRRFSANGRHVCVGSIHS